MSYNNDANKRIRIASGSVNIRSRLTSFLYELLRDHLPAGAVEEIARNCTEQDVQYSNGWLALYADNLSKQLSEDNSEREAELLRVIKEYKEYFQTAINNCDTPENRSAYKIMISIGDDVIARFGHLNEGN